MLTKHRMSVNWVAVADGRGAEQTTFHTFFLRQCDFFSHGSSELCATKDFFCFLRYSRAFVSVTLTHPHSYPNFSFTVHHNSLGLLAWATPG